MNAEAALALASRTLARFGAHALVSDMDAALPELVVRRPQRVPPREEPTPPAIPAAR